MYFDARAAKLLPPGQHMTVDGCPGLRLVASPQWRSWVYRYKDAAGRMKQLQLGRWPAMPVGEAVARWQALRDGKAAGTDPGQAKRSARAAAVAQARSAGTTVADVVADYLREVVARNRAAAGHLATQRALDRLLADEPALAAAQATEVTRAQAFGVLDARAGTPTAAAKLRSNLGAAWEHAIDAGRLPEATPNWWRQVLRGRLKSRGKIVGGEHQGRGYAVLSAADCRRVVAHACDHMHPHGADLLVMYLWTGMRGVEILRLLPEHLAEVDGVMWVTLPKAQTKNAGVPRAVDHRVPLFGRAREVVERHAAAGGLMWPDARGGAYTQKAFGTAVYDLMPGSAKLRGRPAWPVAGWSAHRLRATARTLLAGLGCPRDVGEAIIGHVPPETEATYNRHTFDAERAAWLKRLADLLETSPATV